MSGLTLPVTLNPGKTATLTVGFDPTTAGTFTGQLTITSNSSTKGTATIGLSGTGVPPQVQLSWNAPESTTDPIAGYDIYRSTGSSTSYQRLNSSVDTTTTYLDTSVQNGVTYNYIVKSVDDSGVESGPSNVTTVTLP
jgi:fibronectin type 3 domain-containing protein